MSNIGWLKAKKEKNNIQKWKKNIVEAYLRLIISIEDLDACLWIWLEWEEGGSATLATLRGTPDPVPDVTELLTALTVWFLIRPASLPLLALENTTDNINTGYLKKAKGP